MGICMDVEIVAFKTNQTWSLVLEPQMYNLFFCKSVHKIIWKADDSIEDIKKGWLARVF